MSRETATFAVQGMTCGSCVRHINEALGKRFEQLDYEVDLANKTLVVSFVPGAVTEEAIAQVMNDEGYPLTKL